MRNCVPRWDFTRAADGNSDDVEVVVLDLARDLALPFALNRCILCNGCLGAELALVEDVLDVARYDRLVALKQLGHLAERQPCGLAVERTSTRVRPSSVR
jgi:hypothetical protein